MNLIKLAHGSMYMLGAYLAATFQVWTDSFVLKPWRSSRAGCSSPLAWWSNRKQDAVLSSFFI